MRSESVIMYGRQVALVELHALGELEVDAEGLALLDVDHAVLADLLDGVGDDVADLAVAAEMVATRAMSSLPEISFDCDLMSATTSSTAASMPRLRPIGLAPAATFFRPSRTIAWASTVAVVVPSPATSFVAVATSRTSWAPWFSKTSSTSISRAIVTPSLVMVGAPNFLSSTTYRPLGPRVTLTASARMLTPRSSERRASSLNLIPCVPFALPTPLP